MIRPQVSAVAVGMREETDIRNTEGIELVLVVSSLSFGPDMKMSCKLLEVLISRETRIVGIDLVVLCIDFKCWVYRSGQERNASKH